MPVKRTSRPSNNVAHIEEQIAAQSSPFSDTAFAAAAVDDVFIFCTVGKFSSMKSRHWPKACSI